MRYLTNGVTPIPYEGSVIPKGFREITKAEYDHILAAHQAEGDAEIAAWIEQRNALRASAKAKLMTGEPLTEQEADFIVG